MDLTLTAVLKLNSFKRRGSGSFSSLNVKSNYSKQSQAISEGPKIYEIFLNDGSL